MLPPFPRKPFPELEESDLRRLLADEVPEGVELDYKENIGGGAVEFAKDVTSFANTKGGYLVFGMTEENQRPTGLQALPGYEPDETIGRLTAWAQEHIRPRLTIRFKSVPLSEGGEVLVVEVPRSWQGPHEVKQEHRYYRRNQHGKDQMDVDELRMAFGLDNGFQKALEDLQQSRVRHLLDLSQGIGANIAAFLLHLVPAEAVMSRRRHDFSGSDYEGQYPVPHPSLTGRMVWRGGTTTIHNLDGYEFRQIAGRPGLTDSCQVFRNGSLEYRMTAYDPGGDRTFRTYFVDQWLLFAVEHAQRVMRHMVIDGPVAITAAIVGATNWEWPMPNLEGLPFKIQERHLLFPDVLLDTLKSDPEPVVASLSNLIWNAMGRVCSPNFTDGKFRPPS